MQSWPVRSRKLCTDVDTNRDSQTQTSTESAKPITQYLLEYESEKTNLVLKPQT